MSAKGSGVRFVVAIDRASITGGQAKAELTQIARPEIHSVKTMVLRPLISTRLSM